jgi:hypothetical protein
MGDAAILDAGFTLGPVKDLKYDSKVLKDTTEYGYSFWMRFLTRYPVPMLNGKN